MEEFSTAWTEGPALSVWTYDSPRGAAAGKVRLERLSQRGAVVVVDVATVIWIRGAHRPRIGRPQLGTTSLESRRSTLEVLLGRLVFWPHGAAPDMPGGVPEDVPADVPAGASDGLADLARELAGTGLTEEFLRRVRAGFLPDSSALIVLSRVADFREVELVVQRGRARGDVRLAHLPLTAAGLAALEAFARGDPPAAR